MAAHISFASFNLYNFQEAGAKVYSKTVSQQLYDNKLNWTRQMVLEIDADVIGFQELWSRRCLDDVFSVPELADYQLVYLTDSLTKPWYNIAVAAAVRKPWTVAAKTIIKDFPFSNIQKFDHGDGEDDEIDLTISKFARSLLKLKLHHATATRTPDITAFVTHLKSKLPAYTPEIASKHRTAMGSAVSTIRRTAEAAALRWLLNNHMKGTTDPTVLLGDFNDDPNSNTLALITNQPMLTRDARGGDTSLYSAVQMQQLMSFRDVYYTHEHNRIKNTLDHVLVSEEFFVNSKKSKWKLKETRVWNDFLEDDRDYTGDHAIIRASFV